MERVRLVILYSKFMEIVCLKAPGNYSASILTYNLLDLLMGETETPHFYDFAIFGRVPEHRTKTIFIFGDTRIPKTNQEKSRGIFLKNASSENIKMLETQHLADFGKDGHPQITTSVS